MFHSVSGQWSDDHQQEENEVRGGSQPSPHGPPAHVALGKWVSRGPMLQVEDCVLLVSRILINVTHWPGPGLEEVMTHPPPHPHLCLLMAAPICLGHFLRDLSPLTPTSSLPYGQPRGLKAIWAGCLAPSAMTAEQRLRTRP